MSDWPQRVKELSALLRNLRGGAPDVLKAFAGIAQAATASKAVDAKTKELIALGIAVAVRCDDCSRGSGRYKRRSERDARNVHLYGCRPVGNVREPCAGSIHAIRVWDGKASIAHHGRRDRVMTKSAQKSIDQYQFCTDKLKAASL